MKRRLITIGACLVLIGVAIAGWIYDSVTHFSLPITSSPAQFEDMQIALKGSLGEAIFGDAVRQQPIFTNGTGLDALLAASGTTQADGLISAYQKDPAKFKRYAQLFDAAFNARRIGKLINTNRSKYSLPLSTAAVQLDGQQFDPWGHPYCVAATKDGVAVISAGPTGVPVECTRQAIPVKEIAAATRSVFQTQQGRVIVLVGMSDPR